VSSSCPQAYQRNVGPMLASLRCGAKTRSRDPCRSPAVRGKKRCRMHGGAAGPGAPKGNQNAVTDRRYTREILERRRQIGKLLRELRGDAQGNELKVSGGGAGPPGR
jgi:hypothetical protein